MENNQQPSQVETQVKAITEATKQVATAVEQNVPFQLSERNYYTLTLALLGATKLVLESFGVKVFDNVQIDDVANAVATLLTVGGVLLTHIKKN